MKPTRHLQRRDFGKLAAAAAALSSASGGARGQTTAPKRNTLMHVGGDYHSIAGDGITSKENLEYNLRYGVRHLTAQLRKRAPGGGWDPDELKKMKDDCDRHGVQFEAIRMSADYINLRKGPERDRELDNILGNIEKAAQVGVKIITYHWTVIPIRRNRQSEGRGKVTYAGFKLEENWKDLPAGKSGRVDKEDYWERITNFLQKVIPVAKQHGVRMACHPYDPPGLPFGYQGADNWDSPSVFDAIKRYEAIVNSPFNGFQLCLGTVAEGLKKPGVEILPIVRYLAERGKIYQIHMRNIRGGLYDFQEVYPDEGEMDFFQIMRILRDHQFAGSLCPDHMPRHPDDKGSLQSFAFGYGYIKALMQAVNSEVRG
ncbi:MAG TPA: mannonate dehydratase [Bryobacteraceae bacterium]|jgi:mannonate dehydratase|nr:mannonate dehydratase [Bryobacteraceae bacterium]